MFDALRSLIDRIESRIGEAWLERLRRGVWALIPLSIFLVDVGVRWQWGMPPEFASKPSFLLSSLALSLWFWWAVSRVIAGTTRRWLWGGLVSLVFALPIAMSWQYQTVVHKDVNTGILLYFLMEPKTTMDLGATGWTFGFTCALLVLWGFWTACLAAGRGPDETSRIMRWARGVVIVFWIVATVLWPRPNPVTGAHYVSDFHVGTVVGTVGTTLATQNVGGGAIGRADDRTDVETTEPERQQLQADPQPNVVVFLGETLIERRMSLYGYERETTPEMAAFARRHEGELFHFDHAYANSPYTPLSDAASLSGVAPHRERETLHRAPMIWEYGRATGAGTFLLTSKRWSWSNMQLFFLADDAPDVVETGDTIPAYVVNGGGIDDRELDSRFQRLMRDDLAGAPAVTGVYQTNATHYPYLVPRSSDTYGFPEPVDWPLETSQDRYDAALTIVDGVFGRMVETLEETGRLEHTVIVVVPDHREPFYDVTGEIAEERPDALTPDLRSGQRIESCHPTITRIPMFLYIPKALQKTIGPEAVEALRANRGRVVSTLDIVPTLLDLLESSAQREVDLPTPTELDGTSLLEPVSRERTALCMTEPGWETTLKSGIGVFGHDRSFYVREDFKHPYVFDPSEPMYSNEPTGGRPASEEDWTWVAGAAERDRQIAESFRRVADRTPYDELAERLRSAAGR